MIRDTSLSDTVVARKPRHPGRNKLVASMIGVGVLVLGVSVYSFASPWLRAERTVSSERLRVATVTRGAFERSISVQGTVDAVIRPTLYSLSEGVVTLHAKAGDIVEKGQILARIDNPELRNQLEQEQARQQQIENDHARLRISTNQQKLANEQELALQDIELQAAKRGLVRVGEAYKKQVIPLQDFEVAQDALAEAETRAKHGRARIALENERLNFELDSKALEVNRQKLVVEELQRQVAELSIPSPAAGLVGNVLVQDRDKVALNQALMTVVDLSEYEVLVTIPESYADDLAPDMDAFINVQGKQIEGRLASVSPEVSNGHVEGRIRLDDGGASMLKQKQRLTVKIVLDSKEDALTVPRGPFVEDGAGRLAYVVEGDLATARPIQTGAVGVTAVEIVDGLREGEQIVISSISGFEQAKTVLIR